MRKYGIFVLFIFLSLCASVHAIVFESELNLSNFALKNNGSYRTIPDFGGAFRIEEQILPYFKVRLAFERDSESGNVVWSSLTYQSSFIDVSLGPSLYVFNSPTTISNAFSAFHPGINLGLNITLESGFTTGFEGAFAVSIVNASNTTAFLQSGCAHIGYRFPNMIAQLRYTHKGRMNITNGSKSFSSITDYGLYTESFSKPSRFKFPVNIIFRNVRYTDEANEDAKKNYMTIILESGFNIKPNSDLELGLLAGLSVHSFILAASMPSVKKFFFRSNAHIKIAL